MSDRTGNDQIKKPTTPPAEWPAMTPAELEEAYDGWGYLPGPAAQPGGYKKRRKSSRKTKKRKTKKRKKRKKRTKRR